MVSLAMKATTQSVIIRKLSSFDRQNQTKKALWEYDNIIRSIYLLNYVDDINLRQNVQRVLNRGESYHQLRNAVAFSYSGQFRVRTELEQEIWNECARLLANLIIFFNGYLLSQLLQAKEVQGKAEELECFRRISPIAWRHINLCGRYEFQNRPSVIDIDDITDRLEKVSLNKKKNA
jgi:TnpA family transposase